MMPGKKKKYLVVIISFLLVVSCAHLDSPEGKETGDDSDEVLQSEDAGKNGTQKNEILQEQSKDAEVPLPPVPFSKEEIDARIVNLVYPGTTPVFRDGRLLALYVDLDWNGYTDACVLCIEDDFPENGDYRTLSDEARLYQEVLEPFSCSIQFFLQKNGKLYRSGIAPLGRKLVLESFRILRLGEKETLPRGAVGVFKTRGGTEEEWVLFLPRGISRFTIHESLSIIPVVQDIDEDGVVDILVHQQGFEEGSGYETFLVWYKWNGSTFIEYKSTNIVRNLNAFLQGAAEILKRGEWTAFLERVLDREDLEQLRLKGLSDPDILALIFQCDREPFLQALSLSDTREGFLQVIFPEFYETPFSHKNVSRLEIPVQVRFVIQDYGNILCSAVIYMKKNPFESGQFGFLIP